MTNYILLSTNKGTKVECAFFEQKSGQLHETVKKVCAFFGARTKCDEELIARICENQNFEHFELFREGTIYSLDITRGLPRHSYPDSRCAPIRRISQLTSEERIRASLLNTAKQLRPSYEISESARNTIEVALTRSTFSAILQQSPNRTLMTEKVSKL